ncbi:protein of unknown function [Nitrospira defluvii]|jgi:hypothetical protein|uniref:Uncharacterized protein n=1 Tax=Nitrospira defluvii TaxID=330214 RepID=D8PCH4_9BACT|nr:protein of unknown function [Nitrospira defluvii]
MNGLYVQGEGGEATGLGRHERLTGPSASTNVALVILRALRMVSFDVHCNAQSSRRAGDKNRRRIKR